MRIGIDTGGTFTDFVVQRDDGTIEVFKLRSNPQDPASVILAGISQVAGKKSCEVLHGSTVATNALLERKGARTALVTTAGFEDVIEIGRQNRPHLYVLSPPLRVPLSERELRFGVHERTHFDGHIAQRPTNLKELRAAVEVAGVQSIAICLLHSYREPSNEQAVAAALAGLGYLCLSSEICPEFREYERTSTTFLNAYVGPLMDRYLAKVSAAVPKLQVMQSNGGLLRATEARHHAVRTLLSGPAGGVTGAVEVARRAGFRKVLGFDMGGTSTDVCLSNGAPSITTEGYIDGHPLRVPMLDIQTVGAGGGSLARVDDGGLLRVGPESAGADPGPACYGRGTQATVTDAHVVLGRIDPRRFLGGSMAIDAGRAASAIDKLAKHMGVSRKRAALGVIHVANANMERAIRSVSVERGYDTREFALVAFGGCGGLHACEVAQELGVTTVLAPEMGGVLSALGMLLGDLVRDYSAALLGRSDAEVVFNRLEQQARKDNRGARLERFLDMRYTGQSYELLIPAGASFHEMHRRMYGYADENRAVELVTARVRATVAAKEVKLPRTKETDLKDGPAVLFEYGSTTYVPPGWSYRRDRTGCWVLRFK